MRMSNINIDARINITGDRKKWNKNENFVICLTTHGGAVSIDSMAAKIVVSVFRCQRQAWCNNGMG